VSDSRHKESDTLTLDMSDVDEETMRSLVGSVFYVSALL